MKSQRPNQQLFDRLESKVQENLLMCGNCAQTTFLVLQDEFELDGEALLKALTPFPGIALRSASPSSSNSSWRTRNVV